MRSCSITVVLVTLLAFVTTSFASIKLSYNSSIFEIGYLASDFFPTHQDLTLSQERFVWHVLGLVGNVYFPSTWSTCSPESTPSTPCIQGQSVLLPVSAYRLGNYAGLTFILPPRHTVSDVHASAVLYKSDSVIPIASGTSMLNFKGVDVSESSEVVASYVPTSSDPDTPFGTLLLEMTYKNGSGFEMIEDDMFQADVLLPKNFWVASLSRRAPELGSNFSIPVLARAIVLSETNTHKDLYSVKGTSRWASPPHYATIYGNGAAISLRWQLPFPLHSVEPDVSYRTLVIAIEGVYTDRDDSNAPAVSVFFTGRETPTYFIDSSPMPFIPSADAAIVGRGLVIVGINTTLTSAKNLTEYRRRAGLHFMGDDALYISYFVFKTDPIFGDSGFPAEADVAFIIRLNRPWSYAQFKRINFADRLRESAFNYPEDESMRVSSIGPWIPAGMWMCFNYEGSGFSGLYVMCPTYPEEYCTRGDDWQDICIVNGEEGPALHCVMSTKLRRYPCPPLPH